MRHLIGSGRPIRRLVAVVVFAGALTVAFTAGTAAAASSTQATPSPSPTSVQAIVMTKSGPGGAHLANGTGRSLYMFAADSGGKSSCYGACAAAWPPDLTSGQPKAGTGVEASKLSTVKRNGGATQVVYNGHPLYYFKGDQAAGTTAGQGLNAFGGLWWLMSPAGTPIKSKVTPTVPASPSPHSGTGGGGGGY